MTNGFNWLGLAWRIQLSTRGFGVRVDGGWAVEQWGRRAEREVVVWL